MKARVTSFLLDAFPCTGWCVCTACQATHGSGSEKSLPARSRVHATMSRCGRISINLSRLHDVSAGIPSQIGWQDNERDNVTFFLLLLLLLLLLAVLFFSSMVLITFEFMANVDFYVIRIRSNVLRWWQSRTVMWIFKCHQRSGAGILMLG